MQADFDSYTNARDKLLLDMWDLMNPNCTYEETDIYTCTIGCETVYYICNDSVTLTNTSYTYETASAMKEYIDEGVFFKESIKKNTYGDSYKSVCSGHDHGSSSTVTTPSGCDNYTATYYCSGHSVEACFGHKDIEVTVTTIFMEQMFESNELPTSSTGAHYSSYWTRLSKFKSNTEAWNSGLTENYITWANSLYNQNWTILYGIDPLGGISMCARFTEEEIAVILAENGLTDRISKQWNELTIR